MKSKRVQFAGLSLMLPIGWFDVTDDLEEGCPFTLGKADNGIGALQFSVGLYRLGKKSEIDVDNLISIFNDYIKSKELGSPINFANYINDIEYVSGDFVFDDEFIRLWFVTDKKNIAMVSYVSTLVEDKSLPNEVAEADEIVRSIKFPD